MNKEINLTTTSSGITTRIVLLSMLSMRPMHGYELRQVMESRHMHRWADIRYGSIYRGMQQLAREGLLAEDGEEREGNRPTRTIYKITEKGQEELKNLLRQAWSEPVMVADPIELALSLFMYLPFDEIAVLLRKRLQALDKITDHLCQIEDNAKTRATTHQAPPGIHAMFSDLFQHKQVLVAAERAWTRQVLERIEAGAYQLTEEDMERIREHTSRPRLD